MDVCAVVTSKADVAYAAVEFLMVVLAKTYLTTLASIDSMLGMIVEDRRYEVMLQELKRPGTTSNGGCCARTDEKSDAQISEAKTREELAKVKEDRSVRLTDLTRLMHTEEDDIYRQRRKEGKALKLHFKFSSLGQTHANMEGTSAASRDISRQSTNSNPIAILQMAHMGESRDSRSSQPSRMSKNA